MTHDENKKKRKSKSAKSEEPANAAVEPAKEHRNEAKEDRKEAKEGRKKDVKTVHKGVSSWASKFKTSLALQALKDEDSDGATPSPPSSVDGEDEDDEFDIEMMKESDFNDQISSAELKEVHDYAKYLGMDPINDKKFLWIAVEAMTAKLPENWKEFFTADGQSYFYNDSQKKTQWEHPMDDYYRKMFQKLKHGQDVSNGGVFKENINPDVQRSSLPTLATSGNNKKQLKTRPIEVEKNKEDRLNMLMKRCNVLQKAQQMSEDAERRNLQGEAEKLLYRHRDSSVPISPRNPPSDMVNPQDAFSRRRQITSAKKSQVREILKSVREESHIPLALNRRSLASDREFEKALPHSPRVPNNPEGIKELEQRRLRELQEQLPPKQESWAQVPKNPRHAAKSLAPLEGRTPRDLAGVPKMEQFIHEHPHKPSGLLQPIDA